MQLSILPRRLSGTALRSSSVVKAMGSWVSGIAFLSQAGDLNAYYRAPNIVRRYREDPVAVFCAGGTIAGEKIPRQHNQAPVRGQNANELTYRIAVLSEEAMKKATDISLEAMKKISAGRDRVHTRQSSFSYHDSSSSDTLEPIDTILLQYVDEGWGNP